jgi:hypothetical protein
VRPRPSFAEALAPVGLAELDAAAALRDRVDRKYLVPVAALDALASRLAADHAVLEIDGRRAFRYVSTYHDTPGLDLFRAHLQGRRRRVKARVRRYLDAGTGAVEVKLGGGGRTRKLRAPLATDLAAFCAEVVEDAWGRGCAAFAADLGPVLDVRYLRTTLVAPERGERVTVDRALRLVGPDGAVGALAADLAVVECKAPGGLSRADRALRELGVRPVAPLSKYCLGVALTRPGVRANPLLPVLRRCLAARAGEPAYRPSARSIQAARRSIQERR